MTTNQAGNGNGKDNDNKDQVWQEYVATLQRVAQAAELEQQRLERLATERTTALRNAEEAARVAAEQRQQLERRAGELESLAVTTLSISKVKLGGPRKTVSVGPVHTFDDATKAMDRLERQIADTALRLKEAREHAADRRAKLIARVASIATPIVAGIVLRLVSGSWIEALAGGVLVVLGMACVRKAGGSALAAHLSGLITTGMLCVVVAVFGRIGTWICLLLMLAGFIGWYRDLGQDNNGQDDEQVERL